MLPTLTRIGGFSFMLTFYTVLPRGSCAPAIFTDICDASRYAEECHGAVVRDHELESLIKWLIIDAQFRGAGQAKAAAQEHILRICVRRWPSIAEGV